MLPLFIIDFSLINDHPDSSHFTGPLHFVLYSFIALQTASAYKRDFLPQHSVIIVIILNYAIVAGCPS